MIRLGICSLCSCALESPDGSLENVRARSKAIRQQPRGHWHKKPWHVIKDEQEQDYRYWHDFVPNFVR